MQILACTNKQPIKKPLSKLGNVTLCNTYESAVTLLSAEEFDMVVIGPPLSLSEPMPQLPHSNIFIVKDPEDVISLVKTELAKRKRTSETEEEPIIRTKIEKPLQTEVIPQNPVLLITQNISLVFELKELNLLIRTCEYSGIKAMETLPSNSVIVWDISNEPPKRIRNLYVWGEDIKNIDELKIALTNQLTLVK